MPFGVPNGKPKEAVFRGGGDFQGADDRFLTFDALQPCFAGKRSLF
jgi:hypothetical protein